MSRVLGLLAFLLALSWSAAVNNQYLLDNTGGLGRVFDGIGGLSGGGVSLCVSGTLSFDVAFNEFHYLGYI